MSISGAWQIISRGLNGKVEGVSSDFPAYIHRQGSRPRLRSLVPVLFLCGLFGLCFGFGYWARAVTVSWDASPSTNVAGYNLYYGGATRNYTNLINVGPALTEGVDGLGAGLTYYFAVSAYTLLGLESDLSEEVFYRVPGTNVIALLRAGLRWPTNGAVSPVVFWRYDAGFCDSLEWSPDLLNWQLIPSSFYTVTAGEVRVSISTARPVRVFRVKRALCP